MPRLLLDQLNAQRSIGLENSDHALDMPLRAVAIAGQLVLSKIRIALRNPKVIGDPEQYQLEFVLVCGQPHGARDRVLFVLCHVSSPGPGVGVRPSARSQRESKPPGSPTECDQVAERPWRWSPPDHC